MWLQSLGGCSRLVTQHTRRCDTCSRSLPTYLLTYLLTYLRLAHSLTNVLTHWLARSLPPSLPHSLTYVQQEQPPPSLARVDRRLTAARSEPSLHVQRPACRRAETGLQTLPPTLRASLRGAAAGNSGGGTAAAAPLTGMPRPPVERDALRRALSFEPRGAGLTALPPPAGYPPVAVVLHTHLGTEVLED